MRLTMKQRQAVTAVTVQRYRNTSKKVKRQILDEFCKTTGYSRGYARSMLRNHGRQVWLRGKRVVVGDAQQRQQRLKPRYYDEQVVQTLSKLWQLLNYVCGKRLVAIMPELIAKLEQFGELRLAPLTKEKLLRISAASIDRLLQPERRKQQLRQRSHTKPGTLLKHQIPIRTFAEWDEAQPGFAEIDLVAHDGGLALGDYCQTLDLLTFARAGPKPKRCPTKRRCGSLRPSKQSVSGYLFRYAGWIPTTVQNSSTRSCCASVRKSRFLSRALGLQSNLFCGNIGVSQSVSLRLRMRTLIPPTAVDWIKSRGTPITALALAFNRWRIARLLLHRHACAINAIIKFKIATVLCVMIPLHEFQRACQQFPKTRSLMSACTSCSS